MPKINLKKISTEELNLLLAKVSMIQEKVKKEILRRSHFAAEFKLSIKRVYKGTTRAQFDYAKNLAKLTDSKIIPTKSQLMKYFEVNRMSEAIDLMKNGKRIKIS